MLKPYGTSQDFPLKGEGTLDLNRSQFSIPKVGDTVFWIGGFDGTGKKGFSEDLLYRVSPNVFPGFINITGLDSQYCIAITQSELKLEFVVASEYLRAIQRNTQRDVSEIYESGIDELFQESRTLIVQI